MFNTQMDVLHGSQAGIYSQYEAPTVPQHLQSTIIPAYRHIGESICGEWFTSGVIRVSKSFTFSIKHTYCFIV